MIKKIKAFLGLTSYTSPIDLFLASLANKKHKLSDSQQFEIEKYKRIHKLRDTAQSEKNKKKLWDEF